MNETRRVVLVDRDDQANHSGSAGAGDAWRWRDAVTGETGRCRFPQRGLEPGNEVVVELRRRGVGWDLVRVIRCPERAFVPIDPAALDLVGRPADVQPAPRYGPRIPCRGEVRITRHRMDGRSTADPDAGRAYKDRPVVVVWVDERREQCGVRFVYSASGAVRHRGMGRRLRDWRAAGMYKPTVVETEVHVRTFAQLGKVVGHVSDRDAEWALHVDAACRSSA